MTSEIKELFNEALKNKNSVKIFEEWLNVLEYYFEIYKGEMKDTYNDMMNELYISVFGEHLNEKLAKKIVSRMKNENGTIGESWSVEVCDDMAKNNNIKYDTFNMYDWYYVLNMLFSDFYKVLGNDMDIYIKMAHSWLHDADVVEGKAYRYATRV